MMIERAVNKKQSAFASPSSILDLKLTDLYCLVVFIALFFEASLQAINPMLSYIDEIAVLTLFVAAIVKASRPGSVDDFRYWRVCYLAVGLLAIGALSTAVSEYRTIGVAANDAFTCFKFIITFVSVQVLFHESNGLLGQIERVSKLIIIAMVVGWLVGIAAGADTMAGVRYGVPSYKFVFPHPTYVVQALVGVVAVLSINRKQNIAWIALALLLMILTMRSKAFGFVAAFAALFLFAKSKHYSWYHYPIAACAVAFVGWGALNEYYGDINQARRVMLDTSILIANSSFPLGLGFASFGTNMSFEHYSPVYSQYGVSGVYGLSQETGNYITDSFWPALIGQFGWIGFVLFIAIVISLFRTIFQIAKRNGIEWLSPISIMLYLLLSSFGESAFFTPFSAVYLFFILGLILKYRVRNERASDGTG